MISGFSATRANSNFLYTTATVIPTCSLKGGYISTVLYDLEEAEDLFEESIGMGSEEETVKAESEETLETEGAAS